MMDGSLLPVTIGDSLFSFTLVDVSTGNLDTVNVLAYFNHVARNLTNFFTEIKSLLTVTTVKM